MSDTGRRIIFADGTVYEDAIIGYSNSVIWCYIVGKTLQEAFFDFMNAQKTAVLRFQYGEMEDVYEGYTHLGAILEDDMQIKIRMEKEG